MNDNALTADELMQLEALVDGELPDSQYAALLSRLEQSADGWRICALTFLEHQALQKEMRVLTQRQPAGSLPEYTLSSVTNKSVTTRSTKRLTEQRVSSTLMMLAASIIVAFASGFMTSRWRSNPATMLNENIAVNLPAQIDSLDSVLNDVEQALAQQIAYEGLDPQQTFDIDTPANTLPYSRDLLTHSAMGDQQALDHSLIESKEKKIVRLNSLVDAEMEREQSFVPYTREDGQQVVVPVQNLKFRPIAVHGF